MGNIDYRKLFNKKNVAVFAVLLFSLIIRLHHLDHESLWMDELRQVSYYPYSLSQIVKDAASQQQPPLDYWIGHFIHFFSDSDFVVRLPSALFGVGTVFLTIQLVSVVSSWPVGIFFGLITALLPFNLYYSQEARPYSIAIFSLLLLIICIYNHFKTQRIAVSTLLTFISLIVFLFSRTLSPIVVSVSILIILSCWYIFIFIKTKQTRNSTQLRILLLFFSFIPAVAIYAPVFHIIRSMSGRYTDNTIHLSLGSILDLTRKIDLTPLGKVFVVQTEPLTYPLLFLMILSPFFAWRLRTWKGDILWILCAALLPISALLNIIVFQANSSMPFRPPYAIYILPLSLIISSLSAEGLWSIVSSNRYKRFLEPVIILTGIALILYAGTSAYSYKQMLRKSDWRSVANHLASSYGSNQILVFDSLTSFGKWEPTFYGFPRYYSGTSPTVAMADLPLLPARLEMLPHEPIIVLFKWHEYYLTPESKYPIMGVATNDMKKTDYDVINKDSRLEIYNFTGFSVIKLKGRTGNFAADTYKIISILLKLLPENSSSVELHLAAARLALALKLPSWNVHMRKAEVLIDISEFNKLMAIETQIQQLSRE